MDTQKVYWDIAHSTLHNRSNFVSVFNIKKNTSFVGELCQCSSEYGKYIPLFYLKGAFFQNQKASTLVIKASDPNWIYEYLEELIAP
jgi:hypothetical protein